MIETLPMSEVRMKLCELVRRTARRKDRVVITRNKRPIAVLLSVEEYRYLKRGAAS